MPPLYTIGYQQASLDAVLDALRAARVNLVVDTRAVAASRRAGFSKRQLAAGLEAADIRYLHLQKLGTPAAGREAARRGDYQKLWRIYDRHLKTESAKAELGELIDIVRRGKRVCLLCYEREPEHCHRSRIADLVRADTGQAVNHLFASPV